MPLGFECFYEKVIKVKAAASPAGAGTLAGGGVCAGQAAQAIRNCDLRGRCRRSTQAL